MNTLEFDFSSINFEDSNDANLEAPNNSLFNELSSLSNLTEKFLQEPSSPKNSQDLGVKSLRDQLLENVQQLETELKHLNEVEKRDLNSRVTHTCSSDLISEFNSIKGHIDSMKSELKKSDEMILKKTFENETLKKRLTELESRSSSKDEVRFSSCSKCRIL